MVGQTLEEFEREGAVTGGVGVRLRDEVIRPSRSRFDVTLAPSGSRKHIVLATLSVVVTIAVLGLFILCCWSAAADAQGAVAFVFAAPLFGLGIVIATVLAWVARRWRGGVLAMGAAVSLGVFITLFYAAASVPGLRFFSELATGKTPFAAEKNL